MLAQYWLGVLSTALNSLVACLTSLKIWSTKSAKKRHLCASISAHSLHCPKIYQNLPSLFNLWTDKTIHVNLCKKSISKRITCTFSFQPQCYGYQYLYAVDAIDDNGVPDIEVFQEYFSDLSDDKLALQLSDIIHDCSEPILANRSFSKYYL